MGPESGPPEIPVRVNLIETTTRIAATPLKNDRLKGLGIHNGSSKRECQGDQRGRLSIAFQGKILRIGCGSDLQTAGVNPVSHGLAISVWYFAVFGWFSPSL